jgi:hypothetical protein
MQVTDIVSVGPEIGLQYQRPADRVALVLRQLTAA